MRCPRCRQRTVERVLDGAVETRGKVAVARSPRYPTGVKTEIVLRPVPYFACMACEWCGETLTDNTK